jgi:hypothetical protein
MSKNFKQYSSVRGPGCTAQNGLLPLLPNKHVCMSKKQSVRSYFTTAKVRRLTRQKQILLFTSCLSTIYKVGFIAGMLLLAKGVEDSKYEPEIVIHKRGN